jgi:hypothetical protein
MRKNIHDYELKYSNIENQSLFLVKEVAHFRTYIFSSHVIAYFPTASGKTPLMATPGFTM